MIYRITFILALAVVYSLSAFSQTYLNQSGDPNNITNIEYRLVTSQDNGIEGNPYLNDNWMPGSITLTNGSTIEVDLMNYNIAKKAISYKKDKKEFNPANSLKIKEFALGKDHFLYTSALVDGVREIFELLVDGKLNLLKNYYSDIQPGKPSNGIIKATDPKYIVQEEYYYQQEGEPAMKFKAKEKKIIALMKDKKKEMEKFIDDNKLKSRKEEDLVEIFEYYNSL